MSNKINRTKTGTSVQVKGLGKRGIAIVLCFVMLLTALGTGSLLSTAAVSQSDNSNASEIAMDAASALVKAAANGADAVIPDEVINDFDDEPFVDDIEDGYDIKAAYSSDSDVSSDYADAVDRFVREDDDLAESGYNLQHGARIYFNSYERGSGAGSGNNVKKYVYMGFLYNKSGDNCKQYQIIKMDHIANTELYTCETNSSNTNTSTTIDSIFFFSSDASGWATKGSSEYGNAWANVNANCGGFCSSSYGIDAYNNHAYYWKINSNYSLTLTRDDSNGTLANNDGITDLKAGNQKASVYISSDGTSYSYAGNTAGNNQTMGGDVVVGGFGWSTGYETTDKGFAASSKNNGNNSYSQYEKPVLTTWITMKVNETYDGYHFMGWYNSSGTLLESSTTYYYQLSSNDANDIQARFLKPEYTSATPKAASTVSSTGGGVLLFMKSSTIPTWVHVFHYGNNWSTTSNHDLSKYGNSDTVYTSGVLNILGGSATNGKYPSAIALKGSKGDWGTNDGNKLTGNVTQGSNGDYNNNYYIWYYDISSGSNQWTYFEHLGATSLTNNKTSAAIGEEVTLTATAPATGTLKDNPKYYYYYSTNASDANPSWYKIAESSSATQKFYPPANGVYTYKVAVVDSEDVETVVATASTTTTVGVVGGKYITGYGSLVGGSDWAAAPEKGLMTETSSGSGIYTKTFGNVGAGTYQFRVTTLNSNGTVTWETDSGDAISGTASPTHAGSNNNNVQFVLTDNNQVTITYNDSTKAVTVDIADVQALDVVVHAGPGGSVTVTYGTAITTVPENENATIKVAYGDSIDLEADPPTNFSKWYKNLIDDYKGGKTEDYDTLEDEVITQRTVYVACFNSTGGGSWIYSADRTNASPEISGSASGMYMLYSGSDSGLGRNEGDPHGELSTYLSGSDYWCDLTSVFGNPPSSPTRLYIGLANATGNSNLVGDSNTKINGSTYNDGNGPTITNSAGQTLFVVRKKQNGTVNNTVRFIEIDGIDWTKISALGVRAVYSGSGSVNYKFYYKLKSDGGGSTGSTYIPSTNYYAKDSSIRNVTGESQNGLQYNFWINAPTTTVTPVDGQVSVTADHAANANAIGGHNQWVEGFALKGSQITVTTTIPETGSYNYVDNSGNTGTCNAREKYYVVGFSFNGVTPETYTWNSSGVYTCTYTIPADMKESMLEITPILFVRDEYASETVMVYINGYNSEVQNAGWGNTLYLYPFYQYYKNGVSGTVGSRYGQGENFGRYPGQPIVNYGGQLYAQIPLTDDASKNGKDNNGGPVKGITINNGYYDYVHKDLCSHVSVHRQTYDYDDFAKIYNEKKTKNGSKYLYSIYFSFKYTPQNASNQHRLAGTTNAIDADDDASRYNDLLTTGGILNDTSGTVSSSTLITAGENSTGWEDLQDSLGNNVDIFGNKVTNASAEPLRVFSLGYEYNNAGRWATEWAIYYKSGNNYVLIQDPNKTGPASDKFSMIVPSALVYNDKSSLSSATQLDGDLAINGYDGIYGALEAYRGVPVKICYEHDIPDAFSPKNYRCDGRWTYTTVDDYVRSNIKIQYYDVNGILHDDTFASGSHVGSTTGCSAYFTNSAYYGATQSDSEIIDNSKSYTFKAENVGSYEFVGWYMYDTAGHESTITKTSLSADTPRSGNFVLAARFKYIASGNLTISNTLASNSVGRATTYLGVTVVNGNKETVIANVNSNTGSVTLDKSYINASSNYQIIVSIKTVPTGENTFKEYTCYTTDGHTGTDVRSAASDTDIYNASNKTHTTDSYTITVKGDVFDSTTTNQQNVKAIEYISELNPVKYTYSVKFNYTSRQYGNQAFTQTGSLTAGQINDENVVTGTSGQANKKLTNAFLAQIAPHESNFNEDITWDFDGVVANQTCTYNSETNTYAISLNIPIENVQTTQNVARKGYFTVPYAQTNGVANSNNGVVTKADDTTFIIDANYNEYFKTGGNFVTAPAVIHDSDANIDLPFQYWEVSTRTSDRGNSRVISKCYFPEFNLRCLDNYDIKAVYGNEEDAANYAAMFAAEKGTSVSFIGNSRNQWNNGDRGTAAANSGDIIYNDFILTCKPEGDVLFKDLNTTGTKCGVVIQQVKDIEINSSGANAKTLQEYAADYKTEDLTAASEAALALAKAGTASNTVTLNGVSVKQRLMSIDKSNINEKNRCHYSLPMSNTKDSSGALKNAKYLYRAYSYIAYDADGDGTIETGEWFISDDPAYFYMYDIAVM